MDTNLTEEKKRSLYRAWFPIRRNKTEKAPRITYNQRFEQIYKQTLDEYHAELKKVATMDFYMKAGR